jgi:hypothetical protein
MLMADLHLLPKNVGRRRAEELLQRFELTEARDKPEAGQRAVRSLGEDLVSGRWAERNLDLVALEAAELGLRLLVT